MSFAELALICLVGLVGPLLAVNTPIRVLVVVGELVVGVALGATGLRLLDAGAPTFSFMAEIGFGLVMFVAGSHVLVRNPAALRGVRAGALRAVAVGLLPLPVGFGIAAGFGTGHGPLYAVLLASSSASLIMPALSGMPLTGPSVVAMLPQIARSRTPRASWRCRWPWTRATRCAPRVGPPVAVAAAAVFRPPVVGRAARAAAACAPCVPRARAGRRAAHVAGAVVRAMRAGRRDPRVDHAGRVRAGAGRRGRGSAATPCQAVLRAH